MEELTRRKFHLRGFDFLPDIRSTNFGERMLGPFDIVDSVDKSQKLIDWLSNQI